MVMTAGKNGFLEEKVGRNVDMAFIGEDAFGMLPVRKVGSERWE